MRHLEELAERLVRYDRDLAADVVQLIVEQLDGPRADGRRDMAKAHAFLVRSDVASGGAEPKTTAEWKVEFARRERLRALGLLLAEMLE